MRAAGTLFVFLVLATVGCTRPPDVPQLPTLEPLPIERILLRETLTPADVKALFRAINRNNRLEALRPYIEDVPDAELSRLANVLTRYVYSGALEPDGFPGLLRRRTAARDFTALREWTARWAGSEGAAAERELAWAVLRQPSFPQLASADIGFLDPPWLELGRAAWNAASESWGPDAAPGGVPAPEVRELLADLKKWLSVDGTIPAVSRLTDLIQSSGALPATLRQLELARGQGGSASFKGFAYGLARNADADGAAARLFRLARVLDGPSDGLFREAQQRLRDEPDLAREMALFFQPNLVRAAAGLTREAMSRLPAATFVDRFIAIRTGIESIAGMSKPEGASDYLIANLPIFVPSYVLSRWLEELAKLPENQPLWGRVRTEGFSEAVWESEVKAPALRIDFLEQRPERPGGPTITALRESIFKELSDIGLGRFAELLDAAIRHPDLGQEGLGDLAYQFQASPTKIKLREAFAQAMEITHGVRPLAEPTSYLRAMVYRFTRPAGPRDLALSSLETDNLMDSLNRLLDFVGIEGWPYFSRILFDDFRLANLSAENRRLILSLYEKHPKHAERITRILDLLPALPALDEPVGALPSPLAFYQRLLAGLGRDDKRVASAMLSFLADGRFLELEGDKPLYGAFVQLVKSGEPMGKALFALSFLSARDRRSWLFPIESWLDPQREPRAVSLHLSVLKSLLDSHEPGLVALARRWNDPAWGLGAGDLPRSIAGLSGAEYQWLARFVQDGGLNELYSYLSTHGSRASVSRLCDQLLALSASGALRDGFRYLAQIRNERMQRVAEALAEWEESGELAALLRSVKLLANP